MSQRIINRDRLVIVPKTSTQTVVLAPSRTGVVQSGATRTVTAPAQGATPVVDRFDRGVVEVGKAGPRGPQGNPGPAGETGAPTVHLVNMDTEALLPGQPVRVDTAGTVRRATPAGMALGLVQAEDAVAVGNTAAIQTGGAFTQPVSQWDAVLDEVGGLLADRLYYVHDTGRLSRSPPMGDGDLVAPVGIATSTTTLVIRSQLAVQL